MRRPLIAGVVLAATLAAFPLVGHAATSPSITLLTPSTGDAAHGQVPVRWSFAGFSNTTPVDVEVGSGGTFTRVARVPIDEGTPGYVGSTTWDTTSFADGDDYVVRVTVVVRKSARSSASSVVVDNTGPTATVAAEPVAEGAPVVSPPAQIAGTATDALSDVASVAVTFVAADGSRTPGTVTCACNASDTTWSASTVGLAAGEYSVEAVATDALGNVGPTASATLVIVGQPTVEPEMVTGPVQDLVATLPDPLEAVEELVSTLPTVDPETAVTLVEDLVSTVPTVDPETIEALVEDLVSTLPTVPVSVEPPD